ncbi:hypothetical protein [Deinococcus sp.]|uniref:hypothetical protein n=1 Tax=Deinococcus sp. TaxID=47478 RepID=UPI003B59C92D
MNRAARLRLQRWLAALLWLLASLAYITREQQMGQMQAGQMPGMSAGMQVKPSQTVSEMEPIARQMAHGSPHANVHQHAAPSGPDAATSEHASHDPNAPPAPTQHNHAGHCPFCFTAAFALDGVALGVSPSSPAQTEPPAAERLAAPRVSAFHKNARAPPFRG